MTDKPYRKQDIVREHNISETTAKKWLLELERAGYPFERVREGQERKLGETELQLVRDYVIALNQGKSRREAAEQAVCIWKKLGDVKPVQDKTGEENPQPYDFFQMLLERHKQDQRRLTNILIDNLPANFDLLGFLIEKYDKSSLIEILLENLPDPSNSDLIRGLWNQLKDQGSE